MRMTGALIVSLVMVTLLGACATKPTEPAVLNFGMDESKETRRMMWPPTQDAEVPRYLYAGQLTGEANFQAAKKEEGASVGGVLRWLVGLIAGEDVPVVLQRPQAGVVDEAGRILVTDTSRQAVFVFDKKAGKLDVWEQAAGLTRFVAPAGIVLGMEGDVYVADAELGYVVRLNRAGEAVGRIGKGQLHRPVGVAYDAARRQLYVTDTYAHDIKVFDISAQPDGTLSRVLGKRGEAPGEFNFPTYLALAGGELYVTDTMNSRVQVLDAETGAAKRQVGQRGLYVGNLVRPKGVAVDNEGNLYVVESYYDHLLVYNRRGEFLMAIGGTGTDIGKFFLPAGVWTDAQNRIFVADMFNGRVVLFQFLGGGAEGG